MGYSTLVFAVGASLFGLVSAHEPGTVAVLTESNFADFLKEHEAGALVEFYAPWCGHCKQLEPEYNKAAAQLLEEGVKTPLGKVDATVEAKLAKDYEVQGYPTLKYFVGGEASEYDGGRDAGKIVEWIKAMSGPAVVELASADEVDSDASLSITLYATELLEGFEGVAKSHRKKAAWGYVKNESSEESLPKIVLKHKGEELIEKSLADASEKADIEEFFTTNSLPLFGSLDGNSFGTYIERGNGLIWVLLDMTADTLESSVEAARPMFTDIAQKLGSEFSVTWTNTVEFGKVLQSMFGITEFPRIVVQKKAGDKKSFIYTGDVTDLDAVTSYIDDVKTDKIKPHLKSEAEPEEPQSSPVKVVVGTTLEKMIFTEEKDVLLEVYAPWCGHCKKLDPEFLKVGKKVIKEGLDDMLVIAKLDGTENDSPVDSISWSGFPSLFYIKAGDSEPLKYEGGRDAKGMWKWIKNNHSKKDVLKQRLLDNKQPKEEDAAAPAPVEDAEKKTKEEL